MERKGKIASIGAAGTLALGGGAAVVRQAEHVHTSPAAIEHATGGFAGPAVAASTSSADTFISTIRDAEGSAGVQIAESVACDLLSYQIKYKAPAPDSYVEGALYRAAWQEAIPPPRQPQFKEDVVLFVRSVKSGDESAAVAQLGCTINNQRGY
jgi:hypothetical protein